MLVELSIAQAIRAFQFIQFLLFLIFLGFPDLPAPNEYYRDKNDKSPDKFDRPKGEVEKYCL